ncbi:MAG: hypothetical protein RL154_372 [Pseudomonadota bacterium]|jgi:SAM-dependent methyltransferase
MNFERYADEYMKHSVVQNELAQHIAKKIGNTNSVLDLGCGGGAIWNALDVKPNSFIGLDISQNMLSLHPVSNNIKLICDSFDNQTLWNSIDFFETIVSCGALQWSNDLEKALNNIVQKSSKSILAIFTDGTLKSMRSISKQVTFLPNAQWLEQKFQDIFVNIDFEIYRYRLYFSNKKMMFKHLKLTGVHFGERLDHRSAKALYDGYKLDYLEFEVFMASSAKNSFSKS